MKHTWLAVVTAAIVVVGCGSANEPPQSTTSRTTPPTAKQAVDADARRIVVEGRDGHTALDVLRDGGYDVSTKRSSLGEYVTAIGNVDATGSSFWLYSVDGAEPPVGADAYTTQDGERIEWTFDS